MSSKACGAGVDTELRLTQRHFIFEDAQLEPTSNFRILLISADAKNSRVAAEHLKSIGYSQVVHMDNGVEAMRSLADALGG